MLPKTGSWNLLNEHFLGEDFLLGERPVTKGYKGIRKTFMEWFLIPRKNKSEGDISPPLSPKSMKFSILEFE
jgi:hypothetical protein